MKIIKTLIFLYIFFSLKIFAQNPLQATLDSDSIYKKTPQSVVGRAVDVAISYDAIGSNLAGWHFIKNGNQFNFSSIANGNLESDTLNLPLSVNFPKGDNLNIFDQLWVDEYSSPECNFDIELDVESKFWLKKNLIQNRYKSRDTKKILSKINFENDLWKPRDLKYLFDRFFGLPFDANWRYKKLDDRLLVQKRMKLNLRGSNELTLKIQNGIVLDQINLKLTEMGNGIHEETIVEIPISESNVSLSDSTVKINISSFLEKKYKGNDVYLNELFLYFLGNIPDGVGSPLVKELALYQFDADNLLPRKSFMVNNFLFRNIFDISEVTKDADRVLLQNAILKITKKNKNSECFGVVKSIRLISTRPALVPNFIQASSNQVKKYGGPFLLTTPKDGLTEDLGIIRRVPISKFSYELSDQADKKIIPNSSTKSKLVPLKKDEGLSVKNTSGNGINLSRKLIPLIKSSKDFLYLDASHQILKLDWNVDVMLQPGTFFFLGDIESLPKIGNIDVTFIGHHDERLLEFRASPNRAIPLGDKQIHVKKIKVSLPHLNSKSIQELGEILLFRPLLVDYETATRIPNPVGFEYFPIPKLSNGDYPAISFGPGRVSGVWDNRPLNFSNSFYPRLEGFSGIAIQYHLPPIISTSKGTGCIFTLRFNWQMKSFTRHLCSGEIEWSGYLPLSDLIEESEFEHDLGALNSIDWTVDFYAPEPFTQFSLNFIVKGWALQAIAN